jgi:hypothetical protein
MPDAQLSSDDTLSPAQIAAANPKGIPQAVDQPGGQPFDLTGTALGGARAQKALTDVTDLYKKQIGETSAMDRDQERRAGQYRERMDQMITQEGATARDLHPWDAQKELAEHKTDLWSQFGSPGFVISMLASAFTAQPMNTALNAGAAAMNAINQGDMQAYNKQFAAWKENSDLTIKRLNQEHQEFADIDKLRSTDLEEWRTKTQALLAKFGDQRKLALLENGYYPELLQAQDGEFTAGRNLAEAQEAIIQNKALIDSLNGHPAQPGEEVTHKDAKGTPMAGGDPRYFKGTDQLGAYTDALKKINEAKFPYRTGSPGVTDKLQEKNAVRTAVKKEHPYWTPDKVDLEADKRIKSAQASPMTGNERDKLVAQKDQYDLVLSDILPQVQDILKKHVGAAGVAGYATRAGESVGNIFGDSDTDRRQFESDIDHLKLVAPNLLLNRATGRPLSAEHEYIDRIIRGLNIGDTTANTLRSLAEVQRRLEMLRTDVQKRINSGSSDTDNSAAPAAAPAESDKSWDAFPEVK